MRLRHSNDTIVTKAWTIVGDVKRDAIGRVVESYSVGVIEVLFFHQPTWQPTLCSEDAEGQAMPQSRFSMITIMQLSTHPNRTSFHSAMQFRSQSLSPNATAISLRFRFQSAVDSYSVACEAFSERISSLAIPILCLVTL
ncbi:hypothetical protein PIB30_058646 [Stylosanthes scabra]|uniref:Uncharacterized protein n=1 Tax=Stylosanthes scabra TaxID=79078 RepID=A0ABU6VKB0_9FABA|nr:hypothetical protein [Stylosanthes scabra]